MTDRSMLQLPPIVHGEQRWSLPLCDVSAMVLARALVCDPPARADLLAAALSVDPPLAIWSICLARQRGVETARTIGELSGWLAPLLVELLDWASAETSATLTSQQHGRFAALVAESVATAAHTARWLGVHNPAGDPSYLGSLCSRWDQWFVSASQETQSGDMPAPPSWDSPPAAPAESLSRESRAAGDEAWRRWLTEVPGVQPLLPDLAVRLRSTAVLEADFDRALQRAKLESLKEFAYGAGHELNNPLANIASRAQTLLKEESDPERRRRLAAINTQAFRAHEMLADLMLFARPPQLKPEPVDLVELADEVAASLADDAAAQETTIAGPQRRDPLMIEADPVHLRVALRALCVNSLEALGRGGQVHIELSEVAGAASSTAQITVTDDGPGIPPEIQGKIFDPFFSGREAGRGLGFGLSKCWRIVTLHGGRIEVAASDPQGTKVIIHLPVSNGTTTP